jgi:hypothetical protein
MLLSIQFPMADSRAFIPQSVSLLGRPTWPAPSFKYPGADFVRSFGSVRKRKLGGLSGWVGESAICEADRALRFQKIKHFRDAAAGVDIPIELAFRRFFFDGQAVGKFDVGVTTDDSAVIDLSRKQAKAFIEHFLDLPVIIPPMSTKAVTADVAAQAVSTELGQAGRPLARFYSACTISHPPPVKLEDWWVLTGAPLLFLTHSPSERIRMPYLGSIVPRSKYLGCDLSYFEVPYLEKDRTISMWVMGLTEQTNYRDVRALKISLQRLHAEFEALRLIGRNIASGKITIAPFTTESSALQEYLNEATRRISRLSSRAEYLAEDEVAEIARDSEDRINPGERAALISFLDNLKIRKNIFHKVEKELLNETKGREVNFFMDSSSKYKNENSTIGVQGDNASATNVNQVNQSGGQLYANWSQAGGNLSALAADLGKLKTELGAQAKESEHFKAAAAIAEAEEAAKKNDGPGVFDYLKKAGNWALDVATKIGTTVAMEALKKAVGL